VTDNQVEQGIRLALNRVQAAGVLIEGNSFLRYIDVDFTIMVARAEGGKIKASARRALTKSSALYMFETEGERLTARERFAAWCEVSADKNLISALPVYTRDSLPQLVSRIRAIHSSFAA
jgi:hypothetical protein